MSKSTATKNAQIYYPHSANARNEDNMIRLRMMHGVAGYGVYHMLLERLRMSEGYMCELDYDILSWDLDCSKELIRSVIYDFGLFEIINDGQMFSSVELDAYMRVMEQKAAERKAKAQAAANARWNNTPATETQQAQQPELPLDIDECRNQDTTRLDREIEEIKADTEWQEQMAKECGKTKEEIVSYLDDFRSNCILKGSKGGHKNIFDALSHFRSWIYKSGRAKDPKSKARGKSRAGTTSETAAEIHQRLDEQSAERGTLQDSMRRADPPENFIKNYGYDPAEVRLYQAMNHNWRAQNPPSHPEWIGTIFTPQSETMELPY